MPVARMEAAVRAFALTIFKIESTNIGTDLSETGRMTLTSVRYASSMQMGRKTKATKKRKTWNKTRKLPKLLSLTTSLPESCYDSCLYTIMFYRKRYTKLLYSCFKMKHSSDAWSCPMQNEKRYGWEQALRE